MTSDRPRAPRRATARVVGQMTRRIEEAERSAFADDSTERLLAGLAELERDPSPQAAYTRSQIEAELRRRGW